MKCTRYMFDDSHIKSVTILLEEAQRNIRLAESELGKSPAMECIIDAMMSLHDAVRFATTMYPVDNGHPSTTNTNGRG